MISKIKKPVSILLVFMMIVSLFTIVPITASAAVGDFVPESEYLTFTAVEAGSSVTLKVASCDYLQYNKNNSGWVYYSVGSLIALASAGDSVRFRGGNTTFNSSNHVSIGGKVACSGNVMSLRLDDNGRDQGLSNYCFESMFEECTGLTSAPELPETDLKDGCYGYMFYGCTNLTTAPELPATMLAERCYSAMFSGCANLTTAPELPATTLARYCYTNMFSGCGRLTTAPELPATSLAPYCYGAMFAGCTSLTTAPELPATTLESGCYSRMFYGCSSIKLSETQTAEYSIPYSVPSGGNGTTASNALNSMFAGTGGTFKGTPVINKTYYVPAPTVPVTDLDFEEHYGEVTVGGKTALTAMIEPDDATDKTVKWSVTQGSDKIKLYEDADCTTEVGEDATDCLTVYVMGVAEGDAVVTVTSNADPTMYAYCDVNVKVPETITIDLNPDNATVIWYDATDSDGYWSMEAAYNDGCYLVLKGNSNQPAGTYEWADMGSGCEIIDYEANKRINFVDGSCTVTVNEDVVTVSGTFTGRDRNTYVVTVTYEAPYYTITDESVNGTVTAEVNGADVTKAKAGKTVLLNVAPADGYQLKFITASAQKTIPEDFSDLVALMGDAVFDGDENYDCGGYTCKVEDGKFVVYNGANLLAELSESNMTGFNGDSDYCVEVNSNNVVWNFYVENGEITGIDVMDADSDYDIIFSAVSGSKSTGSLPLAELALTTVTEGSQYSFTMPNKPVTVTAEFEAIPTPAPAKLTLNVGENGKVVMNNGTFGNATDASNISEIRGSVNVADGYNGSIANVSIVDGHTCNIVEGGSINIATGGEVSFYPSADNTGKITAIPDEGYICTGWYNGDTRYTTKDTIDYQEISEDMTLTAKFAPDLFPQHSITLGGNIGVNFYINSAAANFASASEATVKFTWDGGGEDRTKEVNLKELTTDADGYYKATVDVVAAQMAHKIHAEVYLNGKKLEQTDDYSVQDYAETVFTNPEKYDSEKPEQLRALVKALLNYGANAQTVFYSSLKEHPALANKTVGNNGYADVTAEQIGAAIKGESADLNKVAEQLGAKYYTSSLIYLSKNTLRIYFTTTTYPGTMPNAGAYTGSQSDYYYWVDHENIPAAELDEQKELKVGDYTFTFTALDYAKAVVDSGKMEPDQKNLAKSLYLYNQKANAYFDAAPAPVENVVDLGALTGDYEAQDGDVLTGTLAGQYKITIADGATVTLKDATITCLSSSTTYDGIALLGDATILLEGENTVKGGYKYNAGIFVPEEKTLTIDGTGSLNVSSGGAVSAIGAKRSNQINGIPGGNIVINGGTINATGGNGGAGIGGCTFANCGTITINGGTVTAVGNDNAPGIGSGNSASFCASITINGGTVTATGNKYAAGIGSGRSGNCGDITIAGTVTQVTATKGELADASIGAGYSGTCGTVTIGGAVVDPITESPYTYQPN